MTVKRKPRPTVTYSTDLAFAAAAAAFRINGNKYETLVLDDGQLPQRLNNKSVLRNVIQTPGELTEQDHEFGVKIREHIKTYLFKIVAGTQLTEFDSKALSLATLDEISERDLGYVAFYPVVYQRDEKRRTVDERIYDCAPKYVGELNEKVALSVEVVKSFFSRNWNTYYMTAITSDNLAVRFSLKEPIDPGTRLSITGKVTDLGEGFVTKLNYVKLNTK